MKIFFKRFLFIYTYPFIILQLRKKAIFESQLFIFCKIELINTNESNFKNIEENKFLDFQDFFKNLCFISKLFKLVLGDKRKKHLKTNHM